MPVTALRFFLFFFCLVFATRGSAQAPLIVKDYTNCTVGLQDKTGRWIAQPVYMHIDPFVGNFAVVQKNNLHGLIDKNGREVIKPEWSTIRPLYGVPAARHSAFIVTNGAFSTSVIDTNGRVILSCPYKFIDHFRDSAVLAHSQLGIWVFVHLNGTIATAPAGIRQPEWVAPGCYRFEQEVDVETPNMPGYTGKRMRKGIVHTSGKIIIPPRYEHVEWCSIRFPMFEVRNGIYTGYYTLHGEQLWDCKFTDVQAMNGGYHGNLSAGPCFARYEKKWGLMDVDGDTLLPFVYDVQPRAMISGQSAPYDTTYIINVGDLFGILRGGNDWLLEPIYQAIMPMYGSYSGWQNSYCCCKNGKWGCITYTGEEIVPLIYDTIYTQQSGDILFWSPEDAGLVQYTQSYAQFGLTQKQFDARPRDTTRTNKNGVYYSEDVPKWFYGPEYDYNYAWEDYWWTLYPEEEVDEKMKGAVNPYPYLLTYPPVPQLVYSRLDTVPGNAKGFTTYLGYSSIERWDERKMQPLLVVEKDSAGNISFHPVVGKQNHLYVIGGHSEALLSPGGRVIVAPGIYRGFEKAGNYFSARNSAGDLVILDSAGNLSWKTNALGTHFFSGDTVWMSHYKKGPPGKDRGSAECDYRWSLVDLAHRTTLIDSSVGITRYFGRSGISQVSTRYGNGYFNSLSLKMYVQPIYEIVFPITSHYDYFAVTTCSGKVGICDSNNVLVADTAYKSIIRTRAAKRFYTMTTDSILPGEEDLYLLISASNKTALFSSVTGLRPIDSTAYERMLDTIAAQTARNLSPRQVEMNPYSEFRSWCYNCPLSLRSDDPDTLSAWQAQALFPMILFDATRTGTFDNPHEYGANRCLLCHSDPAQTAYGTNPLALDPVIIKTSGDSLLSLVFLPEKNTTEKMWPGYTLDYRTVLLFANGARTMTLDSLFTGEAWRTIITDSVMAYLDAHKGIDADCSRPDLFPKLLNNSFLVMKDGLYLYPSWKKNTDGSGLRERPVIMIPWSVLEAHLRADVKNKIISPDE